jgi:hypothetical protein
MSLRDELEKITKIGDATKHRGKVIALAYSFPHSIEYVQSDTPIERYTCIVHAIDFIAYEPYEIVARDYLEVFAGSEFLRYLLDNDILESSCSPKSGDMVFYSDPQKIQHAGIFMSNNCVKSKWGTGNLWRHGLLEVPSSYGKQISYYSALPREEMIEHFFDFAETKGIQFETA